MVCRLIALFILGLEVSFAASVKLLHYNIKELDSVKIKSKNKQIDAVYRIIHKKNINVLSLNEIQFDQKNIPTKAFTTQGKNLNSLLKQLDLNKLKYTSFHPANTGKNAKSKANGSFYTNTNSKDAREHADQLNFGVMPAQYSSALATQYKIINETIISQLKWREFNPKVDFSKYKTADGKNIPEDMLLFDKNFSDITLDIAGKRLHLIMLHTVPSYHFGNEKSINILRNAEQLKFLEWYLTGNTAHQVRLKNISPLKSTDYFIAVGDFNVSYKQKNSPGAKVMNRILTKTKPWIAQDKMNFTNESPHWGKDPMRLMLDYIVVSKNIKINYGEIMHPDFKRIELGCDDNIEQIQKYNKMTKITYLKDGRKCHALVTKDYFKFKQASDHYPLYGEFEL